MLIEKQFVMNASPADAWRLLLDVPRVAGCLPGAALTETIDGRRFKGNARVKVGPVVLQFAGEAELISTDDVARIARMRASGSDTKGRGNVQAELVYRLEGEESCTRVYIETNLRLSGSVAQYGRATGLLDEIAGQFIEEFATCLKQLQGEPAQIDEDAGREAPQPVSIAPILWRALIAWLKGLVGAGAKGGSTKREDAGPKG